MIVCHHRDRLVLHGAPAPVPGAVAAQPGLPQAAKVRGERSLYIIVVEIIPTMTSLLVASFLTNALYAVLFSSSLQFIGLGNPSRDQLGDDAVLGARTTRRSRPACRCGSSCPACASSPLGAAFALLNYAFDEIGNPALRPVRSMRGKRVKRSRVTSVAGQRPGRAGGRDPEVRDLSVEYAMDRGTVRRRGQRQLRPGRRASSSASSASPAAASPRCCSPSPSCWSRRRPSPAAA